MLLNTPGHLCLAGCGLRHRFFNDDIDFHAGSANSDLHNSEIGSNVRMPGRKWLTDFHSAWLVFPTSRGGKTRAFQIELSG